MVVANIIRSGEQGHAIPCLNHSVCNSCPVSPRARLRITAAEINRDVDPGRIRKPVGSIVESLASLRVWRWFWCWPR